ncbi:hypothetical protein X748_27630 [Mesorhizobium sp. LNJC386A00]|nr:hypothetical protein X748_27630 [Mesorhizobium sp. LNJC386A00]
MVVVELSVGLGADLYRQALPVRQLRQVRVVAVLSHILPVMPLFADMWLQPSPDAFCS